MPFACPGLIPTVGDTGIGHVADRFNFVNPAVTDLEDMGGRQIEHTPIVGAFGDTWYTCNFYHLGLAVMTEYGKGEYQSLRFVNGEDSPVGDVGDIAPHARVHLFPAFQPAENR